MRRFTKLCSLVLVMCMLSNYTLFAYTGDKDKTDPATTEEATAEETTEEATEKADEEEAANEEEADEAEASEEASSEAKSEAAQWTVLLYLCGTDLESDGGMASNNLEMISKTIPDGDVNFLIETGGTKEWHAKDKVGLDIANDKLQRWSYNEDGFTLVDEQENASMAKHTTLSDFIKWGAENYPAKKNLLIIWDHGCGSARGLVADELHDFALMSLDGLESALKDGGVHFDLLMTDTCLMANLETAQVVSPYADYLVASEEVVPGLGSNYEEWLQDLYDEPECGPKRLGKNICDATQLMYAERGDDAPLKGLTFSVIDLSKTDTVAEAFNDYMKEVVGLIPDPVAFGTYLKAVSKTDRYSERKMWDLYDLARRGLKGGISKKTVMKVQNAVDDAVVANIRGSYHPYSHGLSVYLAYNDETGYLDRLVRSNRNPWQMAFLDAVSLKWDAPEWACETVGDIPQIKPELYTAKFDTEPAKDQSCQLLKIHSGVDSGGYARYELQRYDEQNGEWYCLGESEDVKLLESGEGGLTLAADFTGKWPAIGDKFLYVTTKDVQGDTVLMQASVFVPEIWGRSKEKKLRITAKYPENMDYAQGTESDEGDEESDEEHAVDYMLTGLWDEYDSSTGLIDRNTFSMSELAGLSFEICKPEYSDYYKRIGDLKCYDAIPFTMDLEIEDTVLPSGKYRIRYSITDMLDRTYYTDFVNLTWDGQKSVYEFPPEEEEPEEAVEGSEESEEAVEASEKPGEAAKIITMRDRFTRGIFAEDTGYYTPKLFSYSNTMRVFGNNIP